MSVRLVSLLLVVVDILLKCLYSVDLVVHSEVTNLIITSSPRDTNILVRLQRSHSALRLENRVHHVLVDLSVYENMGSVRVVHPVLIC